MERYQDAVLDLQGNALAGATVTVTLTSDSSAAELYSGNGTGALDSNVLTTDASGEYGFYAANGHYTVSIAATGYATETKKITLFDIVDYEGLAAIAGLTLVNDSVLQVKADAIALRTIAQLLVDLQGTGLLADMAGFRTIPQNAQSADYTCVAADSGKHILHPAADTNARTYTIPANASVAFPVGTVITFVNETAEVVSVAITSDTLALAGTTTTGTRSLAQNGVATALKVTSTKWIISGTGLT